MQDKQCPGSSSYVDMTLIRPASISGSCFPRWSGFTFWEGPSLLKDSGLQIVGCLVSGLFYREAFLSHLMWSL